MNDPHTTLPAVNPELLKLMHLANAVSYTRAAYEFSPYSKEEALRLAKEEMDAYKR